MSRKGGGRGPPPYTFAKPKSAKAPDARTIEGFRKNVEKEREERKKIEAF